MSTFDELRAEHEAMKANAKEQRKAFRKSPEAKFGKVMEAAMVEYHRMRKEGVALEDACKGIEAELRASWPVPPSKFGPACETCSDTGWQPMTCWHQQRCARQRCHQAHPAQEHSYVVPCGCQSGDKFRRRVGVPDDAVRAVGRTQRRSKGFTRFGS